MTTFIRALRAHHAGQYAEAERGYREVLAAGEHPNALANLGLILSQRFDPEAEGLLRQAVQIAPEAPYYYNLGNHLARFGRLTEAADVYGQAYNLNPAVPGLALNYGNTLLALGAPHGWALYDERPERVNSEAHRLGFPEWRVEPLAGKRLFIWHEQGFGDQIFAARFVADLKAAEVTVACRPPLARLFSQLPVRVASAEAAIEVGPHDYWTHPLSLSRWSAAQRPAPYLRASGTGKAEVGVAWRGNKLPDPHRSLPDTDARRLIDATGAISLHPEDTGARDFQDTAEIIAGLRFVISIDTSVAHLAGALGKPGIVLLHHRSHDWRWRGSNGRSIWYPSLSLVRQSAAEDWSGAIDRVISVVN